jgi:hypothetical protein
LKISKFLPAKGFCSAKSLIYFDHFDQNITNLHLNLIKNYYNVELTTHWGATNELEIYSEKEANENTLFSAEQTESGQF